MTNRSVTLATCVLIALGSVGCATDEFGNRRPLTNAEKGAMIGAGTGALLGFVAKKDHKGRNALIGAIGGGLTGGVVGNYMDSQRKDFEKVLAPEVSAGAVLVEKHDKNSLLITMTAQTSFDTNSTDIKPAFHSTLDKIAEVLVKYGKTYLVIVGHTDNVGSNEYNQALSVKRADAVEGYLRSQGVIAQRLESHGKGEAIPRASNDAEDGRRLNRRVEIIVEPVMQEAAAESNT